MNALTMPFVEPLRKLSEEGRARLLSCRGEPLFLAGWERALFIHFEVDAERLQRDVPYPLDLRDGRAYVSLVAFTMREMRFRVGGKFFSWMLKPIATHEFLNVRTYVKHGDDPGIYFLTEWLSNWLSVQLGPLLYGLPYHYAKINYQHRQEDEDGGFFGLVEGAKQRFEYRGAFAEGRELKPAEKGSPDEFLMERYTAYTAHGAARRFFRIWHPPWPQARVNVEIIDDSLLKGAWPWFEGARLAGANYSPGFNEVWMGRAHRIR
jgi:uncharacterized protein YqjF (DUF2071 family)